MSTFKDVPVDVGIVYEGDRIRANDMYFELGGLKVDHKFELVKAREMGEIEDGKIDIIGPDIKEMEEGGRYPFGLLVEVAGKQIEEDLAGVLERRIHDFTNYIEGFMHLNQRYDVQMRLSKKSFQKGLNSFKIIGKILEKLYKNELPIIEKIQIIFITDPKEVKKRYDEALKIYETRDAKARGLKDEDVSVFYGCSLCQSFAPTHCCFITPQRYSNCGAISWFDGRAASRVDPKGPIFAVKKGDMIDAFKGEYTGVNASAKERSLGEVTKVWLYSAFGYPHTSCGCFEAVAFYIPEVDGLGIIHRDFKGKAVNGLPFSTMADSTAGGRQVDGFHGISIEYMRSPKFLQVDDGWKRIVWMPARVKERVQDFIPKEVVDKIATEEDAENIEVLKKFLVEKNHPVTERWGKVEVEVSPEEVEEEVAPVQMAQITTAPVSGGGFKIILKDAKIKAKKLIIKPIKRKK